MTDHELLIERALRAFDALDDFGRGITLHAARASTREELGNYWRKCDSWTLEHVVIEEMEDEARALKGAAP